METSKELLVDFYSKYAPEKVDGLTDEKIRQIDSTYDGDYKTMITDLYTKYAPDQNLDDNKINKISEVYGLTLKKKESTTPTGGGESTTGLLPVGIAAPTTSEEGTSKEEEVSPFAIEGARPKPKTEKSKDGFTIPSIEVQDNAALAEQQARIAKGANTLKMSLENKEIASNLNNIAEILNQQSDEIARFDNEILAKPELAQQLSQERNKLVENYNQAVEQYKSLEQKKKENQEFLDKFGSFTRKANLADDLLTAAAEGTYSLGAGIAQLPAFLNDFTHMMDPEWMKIANKAQAEGTVFDYNNALAEWFTQKAEDQKLAYTQNYEGSILEDLENGNKADAASKMAIQTVKSLPMMAGVVAASTFGGPAGLVAMGSISAAQQKAALQDKTDMTENEKMVNALGYGAFEVVGEGLPTATIAKYGLKILKIAGKEAAEEAVKKTFVEYAKKTFAKLYPVTAPLAEAIGEMGTALGQNFTAKYTGEDPNRNLSDGVVDAGLVGLGMGATLSAPATIVMAARKLKGAPKQPQNVFDNPNVSPETKQVFANKFLEENEKNNEVIASDMDAIQNAPEEQVKKMEVAAQKILDNEKAISDPALPESAKKPLEEENANLQKELDAAIEQAKATPKTEKVAVPKNVTQGEIETIAQKVKDKQEFTERENQIVAALPQQVNNALKSIGEKPLSAAEEIATPEADIERRRQEELNENKKRQEESLKKLRKGTPINKDNPNATKVGNEFNLGLMVLVENTNSAENYDPNIADNDGKGYKVITKVYEYGEMKDGKQSKAPKIEVTIFNNKADADAYFKNREGKYETKVGTGKSVDKINAKYDAELAALKKGATPEPAAEKPMSAEEKRKSLLDELNAELGIEPKVEEPKVEGGAKPAEIVPAVAQKETAAEAPQMPTEEAEKEYTATNLPKPVGDFDAVDVRPYTKVEQNKFKPNQQLKMNQGTYEAVRLIADPDLIDLITIGSREIYNFNKPANERKPVDSIRKEQLEKKYGTKAQDAYKKAKKLAKENRQSDMEVFVFLGEKPVEAPVVKELAEIAPKKEALPEEADLTTEEIVQQMRPITDEMAKVEMEFSNRGYEIDWNYDNEIQVTDKKTGEAIDPEDLPNDLLSLAGKYEGATSRLGDYDYQSYYQSLEQSRKALQGEEIPYEEVKPAGLPEAKVEGGAKVEESENVKKAKEILSNIRGNIGSLSGDRNASTRAFIIEALTGKKPSKKNSGINNVMKVVEEYIGVKPDSKAGKYAQIEAWAKGEKAAEIATPKSEEAKAVDAETPGIVDKTPEEIEQEESKLTDRLLAGEAEKRRKDGQYTKDGVVYKRNEKSEGVKGKSGEVRFTNQVAVPFTYKLVEAEELQPSHINGVRNPNHFIPETQPKSRTDQASIQAEDSFAENPRFNELGENTNAYSGAPIINERGEVIQGNNRSAGLKKGYRRGNEKYKNDLANNAEQFGLTKEQVEGMKNPVLVREIKVSDEGAVELGNYDVKDLETGGKRRLDPVTIVRRMPLNAKAKIAEMLFGEEGKTLNQAIRDNQRALMDALSPYLNQAQRNTILKEGVLTETGAKDLEGLIQHFMFDNGDPALAELFENMSHNQKEGLRKSLPFVLGTEYEKSILPEIQNAILAINEFNSSGKADFDTWRKQVDMFTGKTPEELYTPTEIAIAEKLINAKTQKDITKVFAQYSELVNGSKGDMFSEPTEGVSKKEAVKQTLKTEYNEKPKEAEQGIAGGEEAPAREKVPEVQPEVKPTEAEVVKEPVEKEPTAKKEEPLTPKVKKLNADDVEVDKSDTSSGTRFWFNLGDTKAKVMRMEKEEGPFELPSWAKREHHIENIWRDEINEESKGLGMAVILKILQNAKKDKANVVSGIRDDFSGPKLHEYYKKLGFQDAGPQEPNGFYIDLRTDKPIEHIQKLIDAENKIREERQAKANLKEGLKAIDDAKEATKDFLKKNKIISDGKTKKMGFADPEKVIDKAFDLAKGVYKASFNVNEAIKTAIEHITSKTWYKSLTNAEKEIVKKTITDKVKLFSEANKRELAPEQEAKTKAFVERKIKAGESVEEVRGMLEEFGLSKEKIDEMMGGAKAEPTVEALKDVESTAKALKNDINYKEELKKEDVLDDVTDEKIGEKEYKSFEINTKEGGTALGRIYGDEAYINSIKSSFKEGSNYDRITGSKIYDRVISELSKQGIKTINVTNQSRGSRIALSRLVDNELLSNPRNLTGISVDRHPVTFDINTKKVRPSNEILAEAYHKAKADGSNPELVKAVEKAVSKQAEMPKAEMPKVEEIAPKKETIDKFSELTNFDQQIESASTTAKKRQIEANREKWLNENPSMKDIYANSKEIIKQLEDQGIIKEKKGPCF